MESIVSVQCRVTGHFGPSPFTSGANVDWPGFAFPSMARVIDTVCHRYGVTRVDLVSDRRTRDVLIPRHIGIFLCRKLTPCSFPQIGRAFGNRDHGTAMNAYAKVRQRMKDEPGFRSEVERLAEMIGGRV